MTCGFAYLYMSRVLELVGLAAISAEPSRRKPSRNLSGRKQIILTPRDHPNVRMEASCRLLCYVPPCLRLIPDSQSEATLCDAASCSIGSQPEACRTYPACRSAGAFTVSWIVPAVSCSCVRFDETNTAASKSVRLQETIKCTPAGAGARHRHHAVLRDPRPPTLCAGWHVDT